MKNQIRSSVVQPLAVAIVSALACAAAQAESSVTLYGVADAGIAHTSKKTAGVKTNTTGLVSGGQGASRLGFRGTEDISPNLKVNFVLETGINLADGSTLNGRHFGRAAWLGLQGQWGEVRAGRQTLPSSEWFASTASPFGDAFSHAGIGKSGFRSANTVRNDRVLKYHSPKFGPVDVAAAYSFNSKGTEQERRDNLRVYSLAARLQTSGLTLVGTYDRVTPADTDANAQGRKPSALQVGGNYQWNATQLYAAWARQKDGWVKGSDGAASGSNSISASDYFDGHVDAYLVGAKYTQGAHALFGAYHYNSPSKKAFANGHSVSVYNVGYTYNLSKRTQFYGVLSYHDGDLYGFQANSNTKETVIGISHKF